MRRALKVAAVVILAACGCDSDPIQVGPDTDGSIRGTVTDNAGATVKEGAMAWTGNGQAARILSRGADGVYTFGDNWLRELIGLNAL